MSHEWTVAIRPATGEKLRKITKIIGLSGNGFSVLVPYHKAHTGYLFKQPVTPGVPRPRFVAWEAAEKFTADDKVKLSYHTDGFAEFSGDRPGRVTSSRDPVSGEAKGLGLFSAPLSRSIFSGPSLTVTVYGLDQFEIAKQQDNLIVFETGDLYYRGCTPEDANVWMLTIYAFSRNVIPPIRIKRGQSILVVAEPLNGQIGSVLELAAVYLPEERMFLGLCINCWNAQLESDSGWVLNGPGDYTQDHRGHVLMGIFPRTQIPIVEERSLDRKPKVSSDSERVSPRGLAHQGSRPPKRNKNKERNQK